MNNLKTDECYIGRDGLAKLGKHRVKNNRQDKFRKMGKQVEHQLCEEFVRKTLKTNPNGWNILLGYLAYESSPPLLVADKMEDRDFILNSAKREGIGHVYEKLVKLEEQIREEENNK